MSEADILAYLRICTCPATTSEIALSVRKPMHTVRAALKALERDGTVICYIGTGPNRSSCWELDNKP